MKRGPIEVVTEIAKSDPGTADFLAEALLYEALCDEIDAVRPFLERDGARYVAKRSQGALEEIAKRYSSASEEEKAELEALAEELTKTWTVAKAAGEATVDGDWWNSEPRDRRGRWTAGAIDALRLMTGNSGKSEAVQRRAGQHIDAIASGDRYSRARAMGNALGTIGHATGRHELTAAGHLTRLAGEIGPEAQRAFGRGLTRLSYRYRGTERRPDESVARQAKALAAATQSNDRERLARLNNLGVDAMSRYLPQMDLARLSLESGQLPPSRGIIFDAQGNAVTEAVGVNGDHYLPFDLKNLKRLRGGQYVRTRATGGLTDEDIYTGLLTGARQVTVVSNSGVFSVEFDPALRGGRRYSDKARQMVSRYSALLARINDNDRPLLRNDISPREQAMMRREEYARAKGNEELGEEYFKERLRKERLERRFQTKDDDELMDEAAERARTEMRTQRNAGQLKGVSGRTLAQRQKDIFRELKEGQRAEQVRYYQLDGEGYRDAQRALHQEFPYFVRQTQYLPLDQYLLAGNRLGPETPLPPRVGRDIGYTPRNHLGPRDNARPSRENRDEGKEPVKGEKPKGPDSGSGGAAAGWSEGVEPDSAAQTNFAQLLGRSLAARGEFGDMALAPEGTSEASAENLAPPAWADWALTEKGGPNGVARWLLDPKTSIGHLVKAREAMGRLETANKDAGLPGYDKFAEAQSFIDDLVRSREPFAAKAGADPVLQLPAAENPSPPPVTDVYDIGPDLKGLQRWAEKNEPVALQAQAILDDPKAEAKLVQRIRDHLARVEVMRKWPEGANGLADEDHKPAVSHGVTADDANDWHKAPESTDDYQMLTELQSAWALARATQVTAWRKQEEVPRLVPKEETGKRAPVPPRLVLHRSAPPRGRR